MSTIATTQPATRAWASPWMRGLAVGFGATLFAGVIAAVLASTAIGLTNQGRVLAGVRVAGIDVGGLDQAAVVERLGTALPAIDTGAARIRVNGDEVAVSYAQVGHAYDLAGMEAAAFGAGRAGDPVTTTIERLRTWLTGVALPVQIRGFDEKTLDALATDIAVQHTLAPVNGMVTRMPDGTFSVLPDRQGVRVEAAAVRS